MCDLYNGVYIISCIVVTFPHYYYNIYITAIYLARNLTVIEILQMQFTTQFVYIYMAPIGYYYNIILYIFN